MDTKTRSLLVTAVITSLLIPSIASARGIARSPVFQEVKRIVAQADQIINQTTQEKVDCSYEKPEKPVYEAAFIATRRKGVVATGEMFETKVYIRNTGNVPWFSADSGCAGPRMSLGTDKNRDRESVFYVGDLLWESGWAAPNRIRMTSRRVDPGRLAEFVFWSRAPQKDGYFREFYTPVLEGIRWMDEATLTTDIRVGEGHIPVDKKDLLQYIQTSADLSNFILEGEKWIEVDISTQRMKLFIGDYVIREFPVSTGTYRTPTPYGTTNIFHKQEVRIAAKSPHYIMPKWMSFRRGGYGIHALPSLANDGGVFWTEALTHIGTRRSHGCIRLLPADAEFAYGFAEIGTKVSVVP